MSESVERIPCPSNGAPQYGQTSAPAKPFFLRCAVNFCRMFSAAEKTSPVNRGQTISPMETTPELEIPSSPFLAVRYFSSCFFFSPTCVTTAGFLIGELFPRVAVGLFTTDEALISYAIPYMKFFITGMSVFGLQCSAQNTFLGLGQARISLFLAIFRKIILLIPLVYILSATPLGITGVFLAESISDATAATVTSAVFLATLPGILRKGAPKP